MHAHRLGDPSGAAGGVGAAWAGRNVGDYASCPAEAHQHLLGHGLSAEIGTNSRNGATLEPAPWPAGADPCPDQ